METTALLSLLCGVLSLLCLLILHLISPEFKPSWRMISEYALGQYKWLITAFFLLWGASSIFLSLFLWNVVTTTWAKVGVIFLFISGIGEIMGGLFDVKHKWHGLAFLLGVPSLPIAALLIGYNVINMPQWNGNSATILLSSHATRISVIVMAVAMVVMTSGFKKAGIPMDQHSAPPEKVPDGVIAWAGYANRLLVFCYIFWLIIISYIQLSL